MTQLQRNAAIDALSDILLARAASRRKGGNGGGMTGISGNIKVDPRLNKPQPTGGGGRMAVNDPQGILNQRNKTTVAMPDEPSTTQNNQPNTSSDQSNTNSQQPTSDANGGNNTNTSQNNDGNTPGSSGSGGNTPDQTYSVDEEETSTEQGGQTAPKPQQTDPNAPSADYRNAWNNIITRFDRDDVSKDQLLQLIAKIQSGELEI